MAETLHAAWGLGPTPPPRPGAGSDMYRHEEQLLAQVTAAARGKGLIDVRRQGRDAQGRKKKSTKFTLVWRKGQRKGEVK